MSTPADNKPLHKSKANVTTELRISIHTNGDTATGSAYVYLQTLSDLRVVPYDKVADAQVFGYAGTVTFRTEISKNMTESVVEAWITQWLIPSISKASNGLMSGSTVTVTQTRLVKSQNPEYQKCSLSRCSTVEFSATVP